VLQHPLARLARVLVLLPQPSFPAPAPAPAPVPALTLTCAALHTPQTSAFSRKR
jgi:hypothetical protein